MKNTHTRMEKSKLLWVLEVKSQVAIWQRWEAVCYKIIISVS